MTVHRLVREFFSTDRQIRATQIRLELGGLRDDCIVCVMLNPKDAEGQPMPPEAEGKFRSWCTDHAVPAGEYHLTITLGE